MVEGASLDRVIAEEGVMPERAAAQVGLKVARALGAVHAAQLIHRDVKASNIVRDGDGGIFLMDFGSGTPSESGVGKSKHQVGTPFYMAPETLTTGAASVQSDLYSLGVLLFHLVTGRYPVEAEGLDELRERHRLRERHVSRKLVPGVSAKFRGLLSQLLAPDPAERYGSADEVAKVLERISREGDHADVSRRVLWTGLGVAGSLVAVAAALWFGRGAHLPGPQSRGQEVVSETAGRASLVVLPFVNMSSDPDQGYFSDGLSEELINVLAQSSGLKVIGRTTSFSFKGKNEDLRELGAMLGVEHVLEGSVRKTGNQVRITAQLVKVKDGFHLWSQTYDRTLENIFAVQDDIAQSVAKELRASLVPARPESLKLDSAAYDLVLQARYELKRHTQGSVSRAKEMVDRALAIAPDYAPAWDMLGSVYSNEEDDARGEERRALHEKTLQATARAIELDPNLGEAHASMAALHWGEWEFEKAQSSIEKARALAPENTDVMGQTAFMLCCLGRLDEGITLQQEAVAADPFSSVLSNNLAFFYILAGRLDDAEQFLLRIPDLDPKLLHHNLGWIHMYRGEVSEARVEFAREAELMKDPDGRLFLDALVEHASGNAVASDAAAGEFEEKFGADKPMLCAGVRAWRGEPDLAFAWLERAYEAHDPGVSAMKANSILFSLHSDPRWDELLRKVGLPTR